jgi:hypothetical protein
MTRVFGPFVLVCPRELLTWTCIHARVKLQRLPEMRQKILGVVVAGIEVKFVIPQPVIRIVVPLVPSTHKDPFNSNNVLAFQRCGDGRAMKQLVEAEGRIMRMN